MSPYGIHRYRAATEKQIQVTSQRTCQACRKRRSYTQFLGTDEVCMQCRQRGAKS
jgi:uncharacterized protein (DUF983 family)